MALKPCKECGNEVSTKADSCPKCGAKIKKGGGNVGCGCLLVILLIGGCILSVANQRTPEERQRDQRRETARKEAEEKRLGVSLDHFSEWDGSQRYATKAIKEAMHDPDSFEHVETVIVPPEEGATDYLVQVKYRGKNAFGGKVMNTTYVRCDRKSGQVLEIVGTE